MVDVTCPRCHEDNSIDVRPGDGVTRSMCGFCSHDMSVPPGGKKRTYLSLLLSILILGSTLISIGFLTKILLVPREKHLVLFVVLVAAIGLVGWYLYVKVLPRVESG